MSAVLQRTRHPGIYRKGSRYVLVYRERGRQRKESFTTLADALEAQGAYRNGRRSATTRRFKDYALEWLDTYRGRTSRGLGELTMEDYRRSIEQHAIPFFGSARLVDIDPPLVRRYIAELESRGLAPSSVRKRVAPLRALFATAFEDGAVRSNPTLGVRVTGREDDPGDEAVQIRALTADELARVLAELPPEWRLFFEFLTHTGLRISEAIAIRWSDVELFDVGSRLNVTRQRRAGKDHRLKSRHSRRTIPLSRGMSRRLIEARGNAAEDSPVFTTAQGCWLNKDNLRQRVLRPAAERAGIYWRGFGFHTFRHTCASMLFAGGKNVKQVQEWLGHADPGFTLRRYVHLMDEGLGAAEFLDDVVTLPLSLPSADAEPDAKRFERPGALVVSGPAQ